MEPFTNNASDAIDDRCATLYQNTAILPSSAQPPKRAGKNCSFPKIGSSGYAYAKGPLCLSYKDGMGEAWPLQPPTLLTYRQNAEVGKISRLFGPVTLVIRSLWLFGSRR